MLVGVIIAGILTGWIVGNLIINNWVIIDNTDDLFNINKDDLNSII